MDWIEKRAELSREKTAIIDIHYDRKLSYKDLNVQANRWVQIFLSHRIKKGDRVAVIASNRAELFEIMFACGKIGAIFVPLNWRLSEEELTYIITDCSPSLIIFQEKFYEKAKALSDDRLPLISISNPPLTEVKTEQKWENHYLEEDPWMIIYTGGTTGRPKGVVLSYRAVIWNAINTIVSWGLTEDEVTLNYMPLFHSGGINALSIPILFNGGTVVIGDQFHPSEALLNLNKYQCTIALFVPTMYHMMQQTEEFEKLDFPSMKVFLSGGAPCPFPIYEKFVKRGLPFREGYGLTEAGPNNFYIPTMKAMEKWGSVGKPMMFNEVKIVDDQGKEVAGSEVGELLIRGKHVFTEYWNNQQATAKTLENGWLHTGDYARRDQDGYYYIVGRKKDVIITGGENVYPSEIEQWLLQHEAIDEATVVGIPDEKWGERIVAFVSFKGEELQKDELKKYCEKKLAKFKVPKEFVPLDQLPKTPVGKIDKKALIKSVTNDSKT
ncbi:class I adenylate-forming enzyme family protein [Fervidibacillus halotolerans]|uniref:Long-chain fatty acid--CoA ligase n=1 Tax=Fervidibacillus halotolerans TaxID=2980027 RepID=A0A9E8M137_9BACI|nr:long-chain fatty acid--CoA ligase [Fervidibacillus halotolerans]WAA12965.1 long-chain fatty acid--CoA ligase [Fervidibacillus halotolerans]